jgi:hypothetical protein
MRSARRRTDLPSARWFGTVLFEAEIFTNWTAISAVIYDGNILRFYILSMHYTVEGMIWPSVGRTVVVYVLRKTD